MDTSNTQEAQFLELLEQYKKLIFKIANSYCRNGEDRKDLLQEITLQLWKAFPNYNNAYALSTWIYRISLNVAISFYRKEKSREKWLATYREVFVFTEEDTAEETQQYEVLYKLIETLNALDKALVILYMEGKKYKEIAEITGISATNVSTRINRIKTKLSSQTKTL